MSVFETIADFVPVWIPTADKLPVKNEDVIITIADGRVSIASRCDVMDYISKSRTQKWYDCCGNVFDGVDVTAWMPLPKPYKEKKHD